jgi:hypothetical protein
MAGIYDAGMSNFKSQTFDNIDISWDLSNERLTLGGALTLRTEAELISTISKQREFVVYINPGENNPKVIAKIFSIAFESSKLYFQAKFNDRGNNLYPTLFFPEVSIQESYSTLRITHLHEIFALQPRISWKQEIEIAAEHTLANYPKNSILISLKNVESDFADSKAQIEKWLLALREINESTGLSFLIVGEDNWDKSCFVDDFIFNLQEEKIELVTQLAIISCSRLFIGTASGMATPAILGSNPYTIYKHPKHHVDSIKQEVVGNRFPFARESQNIQICIPTADQIVADTLKQLDNLEL